MTRGFGRQPPRSVKVATGSPMGRGISAHFLFNGSLASSVRGRPAGAVASGGPALRAYGGETFVQGNGAGKIVTTLTAPRLGVAGSSPRTFVAEFYMDDTPNPRCLFSLGDQSSGSRTQFTVLINKSYRGISIQTYGNDFDFALHNVGGTGFRVFLVVTYDGNTGLNIRAWSKLDSNGQVVPFAASATLSAPLQTGTTFPLNLMGGGTYNFASMQTPLYSFSVYGGRCLSNAEIDRLVADRNQVLAPLRAFPYAALSAAPPADTSLAGSAAVVALALGTLSTSIRLSGTGAATATGAGALKTGISLAGVAQVQVGASGALSTAVRLAGIAGAAAAADGALSTAIRLAGKAQVQASATGELAGAGAALGGVALAEASGTGALTTSIRLAGTAQVQASASGTLASPSVGLSGTARAEASAVGALSTSIRLAGTAAVQASGSGALSTGIRLSGAAAAVASAVATLSTRITLSGRAEASATASGSLMIARPNDPIDISKIHPSRISVFDGSGSRVAVFEGSGSRVAIFEGSGNRVARFE